MANIRKLFETAPFEVEHGDTKGRDEVSSVHRVGNVLYDEVTDSVIPVMLTVIEYKLNGNRIYSIEAIDIEEKKKPAGQLAVPNDFSSKQAPIADFNAKIEKLLEKQIVPR